METARADGSDGERWGQMKMKMADEMADLLLTARADKIRSPRLSGQNCAEPHH